LQLFLDLSQNGESVAAATATALVGVGEFTTPIGGKRNPPTLLFGGPVLCIAS